MNIQSLKLAFFSPTGTTKAIIQGIAREIDPHPVELIDLTRPDVRKQPVQTLENDLLVVAVPVYVGRVPALLIEWLNGMHARQTPTVCVVVYGNREYDDALLELKDIMIKRGCKPVAGAAFIGEHSFSSAATPIAVARPDAADLNQAALFGRKIKAKLLSISSSDQVPELTVPGNSPYREREATLSADFITVNDACVQCGVCAEACPVGAIDSENSSSMDKGKCILCCACIKSCPENARTMKAGKVKDIAIRLNEMCKERKEPVFFF